ncbi:hypothetical protein Tco_1555248 [Tanacetum coccineum]
MNKGSTQGQFVENDIKASLKKTNHIRQGNAKDQLKVFITWKDDSIENTLAWLEDTVTLNRDGVSRDDCRLRKQSQTNKEGKKELLLGNWRLQEPSKKGRQKNKKDLCVQRFYSGIRAKGSKPGKNQSRAKGSAQGDQEAVKECYKEYIGMVKIYYEGTQRSKQGRPGEDVVGNSSGTAWIKEPRAFAKMSVEIEDTLDGTPRKKSRIARDDVNKESNENRNNWKVCFGVGYQQ